MANLGATLQAPGTIQVQNGDYLSSVNGRYTAAVQVDGNLCVVDSAGSVLWCASGKAQCKAVYFAAIQMDGNFCIYSGIGGSTPFYATKAAVWCSRSNQPQEAPCFLKLEDDGDLGVYLGTPSQPGAPIWSSD